MYVRLFVWRQMLLLLLIVVVVEEFFNKTLSNARQTMKMHQL